MDGKVGLTLGISLCVSLVFATMQNMRKYSSAIALRCLFLLTTKMGYQIVTKPVMGDVNAIQVLPKTKGSVFYGSTDPRKEF